MPHLGHESKGLEDIWLIHFLKQESARGGRSFRLSQNVLWVHFGDTQRTSSKLRTISYILNFKKIMVVSLEDHRIEKNRVVLCVEWTCGEISLLGSDSKICKL